MTSAGSLIAMTEQSHFTGGPDGARPPGSGAPPPGWTPAPLSGGARPTVGRDDDAAATPPTSAPLGPPAQRSVSIQEFAPPKSRLPLVVTLAALLAAGLIWGGTMLRSPLPAPSPTVTASPSATPAGSGLPFLTPDGERSGRWEILQHEWTDAGLEVEIRLAVDRGPVSYSFLAFENAGLNATEAQPSSQLPRFSGSAIDSGAEERGWVFFPMTRGPSTIVLATGGGNQMSALPVPG